MDVIHSFRASICLLAMATMAGTAQPAAGQNAIAPPGALHLPEVGFSQLQVLSPRLLELTLVTGGSTTSKVQWNFVNDRGECHLPRGDQFEVLDHGTRVAVKAVGFKRRVIYAPIKQRDLRVGNHIYLELATSLTQGGQVEVRNPDKSLWTAVVKFEARMDPGRFSPVLHVNQTGYLPAFPKKAMLGYFLGSLGEMDVQKAITESNAATSEPAAGLSKPDQVNSATDNFQAGMTPFQVLEAASGKVVFSGKLTSRPDQGFPFASYQMVLEADFSALTTPGQYRLFVPGLGSSSSFLIDDAVAGAFARTYALGIYHQRCGTDNALPFSRFTHKPCHTAPAEVPDMTSRFKSVNESLARESANFKDNPRHTAPQLKNVAASLYPFVRHGSIDVHGGHHDAGDYSKYTINSAAFIHHLVFAADAFPGVADLDNLGLPESGDGKSDVLQEAKWEADFLAKMQDDDGGFYFLVYPRDREYENDVLPDKGDPQIVFPKNTAATAAAVAALAQCSSSPAFKQQFPEAAQLYLQKAKKGWAFLEQAIGRYGKDGAYQKITHYGDEFMHDDELAWAACELFLATREPKYHQKLRDWFKPDDPGTRRWGWWRLYDAYGCATRSYAFAPRTGRAKKDDLNPVLLETCENEIAAAGEDQLRRARQSAYATSFPEETKKYLSAGWYFSTDAAFDLATACQLDFPEKRDLRTAMREAMIGNLNYEQGCNPVNVTYLTGLGWFRQREIVHQYAQNDRRVLPPSGIPLGNIQAGFGWNYLYNKELDQLSFPPDGSKDSPYPFYDRWGDGFNLSQEFVIVNQARALGYTCWLMAQTSLKTQAWKAAPGEIRGMPAKLDTKPLNLQLSASAVDLAAARVVWEGDHQQPQFGPTCGFVPMTSGIRWIEAEAQLPDGRRVFGVWEAGGTK